MGVSFYQTQIDHLEFEMKNMSFLILFGLLAASQARPENGYSYPRQQSPALSQSQSSVSFQQSLPQFNQIPSQGQQQLNLGQSQLGSSYQQILPQPLSRQPSNQYLEPSLQQNSPQILPAPQQLHFGQNQQIQGNFAQQPQQITLGHSQQSLPQINLPSLPAAPINQVPLSLANVGAPQFVQSAQLGASLNLPQPQNLQFSQIQQNSLPPQSFPNVQPSFNQLPQQQFVPQPQLETQSIGFPAQTSLVTKHVYVHVAPEEPDQPPQVLPPPPPPRRHYKIIFIKAPGGSTSQRQVIHVPAAQQTIEEKTLVYVLVDKPQQPEIVVPAPAPTQPSKPEVYFIKYKPNTGGPAPGADFGGSAADSFPVVDDLKKTQEQPINSGESTSSLFSGGLPRSGTSYGPPGYQKRNV